MTRTTITALMTLMAATGMSAPSSAETKYCNELNLVNEGPFTERFDGDVERVNKAVKTVLPSLDAVLKLLPSRAERAKNHPAKPVPSEVDEEYGDKMFNVPPDTYNAFVEIKTELLDGESGDPDNQQKIIVHYAGEWYCGALYECEGTNLDRFKEKSVHVIVESLTGRTRISYTFWESTDTKKHPDMVDISIVVQRPDLEKKLLNELEKKSCPGDPLNYIAAPPVYTISTQLKPNGKRGETSSPVLFPDDGPHVCRLNKAETKRLQNAARPVVDKLRRYIGHKRGRR